MRLVLLGPPGAGKGTQAKILSFRLNVPHISTGEILRAAVESGSELGSRVSEYLSDGKLVPDDLIVSIIKERISEPDCESGFLLDGFPRTLPQAQRLDEMLSDSAQALDSVVELEVADEILLERLQNRANEEGRSDDNREVIATRLKVFHEQTSPLSEYYKNLEILKEIDGVGEVDDITTRILKELDTESAEL